MVIPLIAFTTEDDQRKMERLVFEDIGESVLYGRQQLNTNAMDANDAVLLYDGTIAVGDVKMDALIMEMRTYVIAGSEAIIALPYTPHASGRFLIHKPRFVAWERCEDFEQNVIAHCFLKGIQQNPQGEAVWRQHLDASR